jgi:glycosyltransferase involved in cell wall biosynthesis
VRILLSAFHCNPYWGSEPGTGWHWAIQLASIGHQVTVLTSLDMREYIERAQPDPAIDFQYIDLPDGPVSRVSKSPALMYRAYMHWQDVALRHIRDREREFDVAHHVTWGGLHLGSELWRMSSVPLIYGPIGGGQVAPSGYRHYFGREWPAEVLRTMATGPLLTLNGRCRRTVRNAALTLVCNAETAAACERLGAKDVRFMMADGLATEAIGAARTQPSGTPVVIYIGRLIPRKAPTLAVEAFAELRRTTPARMVIAGQGPLYGEVEALAKRLDVANDVELVGNLPLGEVRALYDSSSVLAFPSLRESFGSPILEALGRGLPVVSLKLHGVADADTGTAVEKVPLPANPQDLPKHMASALQAVLSDGNWQSRSADGIKFASDWTWPVKATTATGLYQEIAR